MTSRRDFLIGSAAAFVAAPAFAQPAAVRSLLNGRDLAGWTPVGGAQWTVADGILSATGASGVLITAEDFSDFELHAEFFVSEDANSGIFLRCSDRTRVNQNNAYEVNIFDRRGDPTYGTGAIVGFAPVSPMPHAGGRWNEMRISVRGEALSVTLNGAVTASARDATYRQGPIALQYGAGVVRFRRLDLTPL